MHKDVIIKMKFGDLTVKSGPYRRETGHAVFECQCKCGNKIFVYRSNLMSGHSKSCGCSTGKLISNSKMTHKMAGSRFYKIYHGIVTRCGNKKRQGWGLYGGRGIKNQWESFESFRDDMFDSYVRHTEEFGESNTQIDRIDINGNYCRNNCRWVTKTEQANNKRSNILVSMNGRTQSLKAWTTELRISYLTVYQRIRLLGWSKEEALTTPIK